LIFFFARLMRWLIVASGTRNARAISAVVRPPTARSVSASCGRQRRMAAQQQEDQRVVHAGHRFGIGHREPGNGVLTLSARGLVAPLIDPVRRRRPHQPSLKAMARLIST
jgi:hypothetical protein